MPTAQRTPSDLARVLGRAGFAVLQEVRRLAASGLLATASPTTAVGSVGAAGTGGAAGSVGAGGAVGAAGTAGSAGTAGRAGSVGAAAVAGRSAAAGASGKASGAAGPSGASGRAAVSGTAAASGVGPGGAAGPTARATASGASGKTAASDATGRATVSGTAGGGKVHAYDTGSERIEVIYDKGKLSEPPLTGVDNMTVSRSGDLFVCEDNGAEAGTIDIGLLTPDLKVSRFASVQGPEHIFDMALPAPLDVIPTSSELTGPIFDPSGKRLFVCSQRARRLGAGPPTGAVYEITGPSAPPGPRPGRPRRATPARRPRPRARRDRRRRRVRAGRCATRPCSAPHSVSRSRGG